VIALEVFCGLDEIGAAPGQRCYRLFDVSA
jgi:hypothetical protein